MTTPIGTGSSSSNAAKVPPAGAKPPANKGRQSTLATIQAEATETIEVTRQKAAKGDPVAIRKLARIEAAQKAREALLKGTSTERATAVNDGDGDEGATLNVNIKGAGSRIDARA